MKVNQVINSGKNAYIMNQTDIESYEDFNKIVFIWMIILKTMMESVLLKKINNIGKYLIGIV